MLSLARVALFGEPETRVPTHAEIVAALRSMADYTANYAGFDVVPDGDLNAYRATVDTTNKLIVIHGGTLQVVDQMMAQVAGGAFLERAPSANLGARIAAARARFPRLTSTTLGTADEVHAQAVKLLAQLDPTPSTLTAPRIAAAVGVVALALTAIAGTAYLSRHHDI